MKVFDVDVNEHYYFEMSLMYLNVLAIRENSEFF